MFRPQNALQRGFVSNGRVWARTSPLAWRARDLSPSASPSASLSFERASNPLDAERSARSATLERYGTVVSELRALIEEDEQFQQQIVAARARGGSFSSADDDAPHPPEEEEVSLIVETLSRGVVGDLSDEILSELVRTNKLESKWGANYGRLVAYADEHGHCKVPIAFRTTDGAALGKWVSRQRTAKTKGTLSAERSEQLEALGFVWGGREDKWRANTERLVAYADEHGHCKVPIAFRTIDGAALGKWVAHQRTTQTNGTLSAERSEQLEALGFVWGTREDEWRANTERLVAYADEHGHCKVPIAFRTIDGAALGDWVSKQRAAQAKGKLSAERSEQLEALGFVWGGREDKWRANTERLVAYADEHGHCKVPIAFRTIDGAALGDWVSRQRATKTNGKLSAERSEQLEALGFVWGTREDEWRANCERLIAYLDEHGHCKVPQTFRTTDGAALGKWVAHQRTAKTKGTLSAERSEQLEALGFVWDTLEDEWRANCERLVAYADEHGHCKVPRTSRTTDGAALGKWLSYQRTTQTNGTLSAERSEQLEALGFVCSIDEEWRANYRRLVAYAGEHGHCSAPRSFRTTDGAALGIWVSKQRVAKTKGTLSAARSKQLEKIGFA